MPVYLLFSRKRPEETILKRRRVGAIILILALVTLFPILLAHEPTENPAVLHVSIPAGADRTGISDPDPWLNEGWFLNVTGELGAFTLRIEDVSRHIWSNDTHLVVALNDAAYNNLVKLTVDNITMVKNNFEYGALRPYDLRDWPSGDVGPAWFNDNLVNVGMIPPKGQVDVTVSAEFSDPTGVRIHFDAYGNGVSPIVLTEKGYTTHNPLSEDSTVLFFCPPTPTPPVARFSWSPISPQVGDLTAFDGSQSTPDGGTIVSYEWNFGDGSPSVFGVTVNHTYLAYGIYTVTLNVTDSEGAWDIESQNITVRAHPHADFTWSPLSPQVSVTATFDASPSTPDGGTIIGYAWDFGDGGFGTGKIVTHAYATAGTYIVTLNVTDSERKWDTESKQITVKPQTQPPQPPPVGGYAAPIDIAVEQSLQPFYQMGLAFALMAVVTAILLVRRKGKMFKRAH